MDAGIFSTSRRGFLKGLAVGAGGYALGSLLIQPNEAVAQLAEDRLEKIPIGDRWAIAAGAGVYWQFNLYKTLLDKEGREKFIEYTKKYASFAGSGGKGLADRFGFTGNDAKAVGVMIPAAVSIFYGPRQKFEIAEATAEKARVKCLECAFWNVAQAQKVTEDLCSTHSQYYWDGFAKAMNPKLTSTLVKAKPFGDPTCEWVIELKA